MADRGSFHLGKVVDPATGKAGADDLVLASSDLTTHGFRAMARTMLAERLGAPAQVIEAQLAHKVKDALGTAYNRTQFAEQRPALMQQWADYLDRLKKGAEVLPFSKTA